MRSVMRQMLQRLGHRAIEAGNGKEALDQLNHHSDVGAILLDWNMPEMDGMQFLDTFGPGRQDKRPAVIIVSTESELKKIIQAMERGADEYIMKPFTEEILEEKLSILGIGSDRNE
ncbi:MAG: response regulator [Nitrospirae bacterium]|nr:response regulator [Candidatus Manganitrophaceae bacterium]